ncbi:MAG: glycosyltransferase, partial [bacterium]|nr:glycosyltransferase [bacterium]
MKTISLITVYNNMPLLDDMLKTAEQQKNVEIDYIMIDNRNGRFSSAAAALNYGIKQSKGEVVVFLHQDIEFLEPDVLEKVYDFAVNNKYVIFGSA